MRFPCLFLALFLVVTGCRQQLPGAEAPPEITTLILVRHAEKADDGTDDPPLTAAGEARARHLAFVLEEAGIAAIYSTPFERNRATAAPLASRLGLPVDSYDPNRKAREFLEEVRQKHAGQKILAVGHSNTVPAMLNALSGSEEYADLAHDAYDDLYVVELIGEAFRILHLKYTPPAK